MNKLITTLILAASVLTFTGCAQVQGLVGKLLPKVQAGLGDQGIQVEFSSGFLGLDAFCVDVDGSVAGVIGKVPLLGDLILSAIPKCEVEAPQPE